MTAAILAKLGLIPVTCTGCGRRFTTTDGAAPNLHMHPLGGNCAGST